MSTIAVGDIHGHLQPLREVLAAIRAEAGPDDTVVLLGDYIDRGAHSRECIAEILSFRATAPARIVCLMGNHEEWLLRTMRDSTRHSWLLGMEALDTIRSYSPEAAERIRHAASLVGDALYLDRCPLPYDLFFDAMPAAHRAFFEELQLFEETPDCICSHGGLDPDGGALGAQRPGSLIWGATGFQDRYAGERALVYGHWNNAELDAGGWPHPRIIANTIGIDTISHGVLTAIRMPERQIIQSSRHARRASSLSPEVEP